MNVKITMEAVVTPVIIVLELTAVHVALDINWTVIYMAALVCVTVICVCMYCMQGCNVECMSERVVCGGRVNTYTLLSRISHILYNNTVA